MKNNRSQGESRMAKNFDFLDVLLLDETELVVDNNNDHEEIQIDESDFIIDIETQLRQLEEEANKKTKANQDDEFEIDLDAILNNEDNNNNGDDDDDDIDLSSLLVEEEEKKRVAARANAEQHEELKRMLSSKKR